jgi:hypothetical protein
MSRSLVHSNLSFDLLHKIFVEFKAIAFVRGKPKPALNTN